MGFPLHRGHVKHPVQYNTNELQPFQLVGGHYERMTSTNRRFSVPELGLSFCLWQGSYKGVNCIWLRWFTESGEMILTPAESAAIAQERARSAEKRAERLAAKLRELNIDLEELD